MTICTGQSLRVDLTHRKIYRSGTPEAGVGGRSWNSLTLLQELKPGIDPLGPENMLCIAVGPLTGSALIAGCRFIASAKSPLTGYLGDPAPADSSLPSCAGRAMTRSYSPAPRMTGFIFL
jgi:aldehyde:ferredoxin oxidoreductase